MENASDQIGLVYPSKNSGGMVAKVVRQEELDDDIDKWVTAKQVTGKDNLFVIRVEDLDLSKRNLLMFKASKGKLPNTEGSFMENYSQKSLETSKNNTSSYM